MTMMSAWAIAIAIFALLGGADSIVVPPTSQPEVMLLSIINFSFEFLGTVGDKDNYLAQINTAQNSGINGEALCRGGLSTR